MKGNFIKTSILIGTLSFASFCSEAERISIDALKNPLIALVEPPQTSNSSAEQPGETPNCSNTGGPCYIFELYNISGMLTNGVIGGISGADALCRAAAAGLPASFGSPSEYKAMLMDESGARDLTHNWVLHPDTRYLNVKKSSLNPADSKLVFTTDSQAMFNAFPLSNSIIVDGARPANTYTFTGIRTDTPGSPGTWLPGTGRSCFNWTSTTAGSTYGSIGYPEDFSIYAIDRGYSAATGCNSMHGLYCVRQ
ncbi:DUF1554 domain-containing protein [Leptospira ellisii]|uniref:DUF1554 domain-containing protein n=1 Tax=Leptospira ellisii TaxID=2023197 RepID=A0A2N0B5J3_9LEPT|nr:DUF1554 domain-containing protein [Leptospira ellisii]MDV6236574.1 DUF1554 domain-containing protein [Leptospira ellisii]PJZ91786.1 hypothetical protein CH379_16755 [Leptospira ellisii]PKA05628.1 hypothetical protein CH375_04180 [Leptospira ellisii]